MSFKLENREFPQLAAGNFNRINELKNSVYDFFRTRDVFLIIPLSILIFRIFFSQRRASVFDVVALIVLLVWRFYFNQENGKVRRRLPNFLLVSVLLYMLSDFVGAMLSHDRYWQLGELRKYVHVFIGGLLFTTPVDPKIRRFLIVLFFVAAGVAGFHGIWQHLKIGMRSQGLLPHAILYAETLALAWGAAVLMLFVKNDNISGSTASRFFLLFVQILMLGGILFSASRGVWIAVVAATMFAIFMYNKRNAALFFLISLVIISTSFYFNNSLRERAMSVVTSVYYEDEKGSTGTRLELWKGALLIFRESPVFGAGSGDFEANIKRLVQTDKLEEMGTMVHAHNIYLQALATRGVLGFITLSILLAALLKWGIEEITKQGGVGGYIIIFTTVLTIIGGLTEGNLETTKYVAAWCFTTGMFGPLTNKEHVNKA